MKTRLRKSASGRIGSAARRSTKHERDERRDAGHDQRDHPRRAPRVRRAAEARVEHDRREPGGEQRRAEVVDRVLRVVGARVEARRAMTTSASDADRQVDVEDPAPREVVDEEAAEQRPDHGRDAEDRAEEALVAAALARRDDVADRPRSSTTISPPPPSPWIARKAISSLHVLAEAAERRADEEDDDRRLQHDLAAVEVAELAVQRRRRPSRRAGTPSRPTRASRGRRGRRRSSAAPSTRSSGRARPAAARASAPRRSGGRAEAASVVMGGVSRSLAGIRPEYRVGEIPSVQGSPSGGRAPTMQGHGPARLPRRVRRRPRPSACSGAPASGRGRARPGRSRSSGSTAPSAR